MGKIAGIRVHMHWTFLLLLAWVGVAQMAQGGGLWQAAGGVVFLLAVFVCVVLHELGHALIARRYGIGTRDILLLPIGGISRLERMPTEPGQELRVAIAGPLVSLALAALLFGARLAAGALVPDARLEETAGLFVTRLAWVNVMLAIFNLLPAFPMDGGRILRSLLARHTSYRRATDIASYTGQVMAAAFVILGLYYNPLLLLIGFFVFLGARQEAYSVRMRALLVDAPVSDLMLTSFESLPVGAALERAAQALLTSSQQDFPVIQDGGRLAGLLSRKELVAGLARHDPALTVGDVMRKNAPTLQESERLETAWEMLREQGVAAVPVLREGELVGLLTLDKLIDFVMIKSAVEEKPSRRTRDDGGWRRDLLGTTRRPAAQGTT